MLGEERWHERCDRYFSSITDIRQGEDRTGGGADISKNKKNKDDKKKKKIKSAHTEKQNNVINNRTATAAAERTTKKTKKKTTSEEDDEGPGPISSFGFSSRWPAVPLWDFSSTSLSMTS